MGFIADEDGGWRAPRQDLSSEHGDGLLVELAGRVLEQRQQKRLKYLQCTHGPLQCQYQFTRLPATDGQEGQPGIWRPKWCVCRLR